MAEKDIVSKELLKRIAVDIARVLLHLQVDQAEILETNHQCIEERRSDVVARMQGPDGLFLLHIEIQNHHDPHMARRMLRYRSDLLFYTDIPDIRQVLLYIGKAPCRMGAACTSRAWNMTFNSWTCIGLTASACCVTITPKL